MAFGENFNLSASSSDVSQPESRLHAEFVKANMRLAQTEPGVPVEPAPPLNLPEEPKRPPTMMEQLNEQLGTGADTKLPEFRHKAPGEHRPGEKEEVAPWLQVTPGQLAEQGVERFHDLIKKGDEPSKALKTVAGQFEFAIEQADKKASEMAKAGIIQLHKVRPGTIQAARATAVTGMEVEAQISEMSPQSQARAREMIGDYQAASDDRWKSGQMDSIKRHFPDLGKAFEENVKAAKQFADQQAEEKKVLEFVKSGVQQRMDVRSAYADVLRAGGSIAEAEKQQHDAYNILYQLGRAETPPPPVPQAPPRQEHPRRDMRDA